MDKYKVRTMFFIKRKESKYYSEVSVRRWFKLNTVGSLLSRQGDNHFPVLN